MSTPKEEPQPLYRCCREGCGATFYRDRPGDCAKCQHPYIEWLNYEECRAFWDANRCP
jgi:hypothetical protein